jgi:hypothetical protein
MQEIILNNNLTTQIEDPTNILIKCRGAISKAKASTIRIDLDSESLDIGAVDPYLQHFYEHRRHINHNRLTEISKDNQRTAVFMMQKRTEQSRSDAIGPFQ